MHSTSTRYRGRGLTAYLTYRRPSSRCSMEKSRCFIISRQVWHHLTDVGWLGRDPNLRESAPLTTALSVGVIHTRKTMAPLGSRLHEENAGEEDADALTSARFAKKSSGEAGII